MPIARALSSARTRGIAARTRPIGRPRKMVNPATPPSRAILAADTRTLLKVLDGGGAALSLGYPHQPVEVTLGTLFLHSTEPARRSRIHPIFVRGAEAVGRKLRASPCAGRSRTAARRAR